MFKAYDERIRKIIAEKTESVNWKKILECHREMISHIQHDRLIHLIVTLFVGLIALTTSFIVIIFQNIFLLIFDIPLLILFFFYLLHYRFLENTTQGWYEVEESLNSHLEKNK